MVASVPMELLPNKSRVAAHAWSSFACNEIWSKMKDEFAALVVYVV